MSIKYRIRRSCLEAAHLQGRQEGLGNWILVGGWGMSFEIDQFILLRTRHWLINALMVVVESQARGVWLIRRLVVVVLIPTHGWSSWKPNTNYHFLN